PGPRRRAVGGALLAAGRDRLRAGERTAAGGIDGGVAGGADDLSDVRGGRGEGLEAVRAAHRRLPPAAAAVLRWLRLSRLPPELDRRAALHRGDHRVPQEAEAVLGIPAPPGFAMGKVRRLVHRGGARPVPPEANACRLTGAGPTTPRPPRGNPWAQDRRLTWSGSFRPAISPRSARCSSTGRRPRRPASSRTSRSS